MKALSAALALLLLLSGAGTAQEKKTPLGTSSLKNEKREFIANGEFEIVEGRLALRGIKGASFVLLPDDLTSPHSFTDTKGTQGEPAIVRISEDKRCTLQDKNFFFLYDTSYGVTPDYSSSFARNTRFVLPPTKPIRLWEHVVVAGEGGGEVAVKHGTIVGSRNVSVKKATGDKKALP
jgi:hypothetical protein